MKEKNILILEKRGCNFSNDDEEMKKYSDVGNYRVYSHCIGINNISYHLEFSRGYQFELNKRGKMKRIHGHKLIIETQYDTDKGSYRNLEIEKNIYNNKYNYTLENIKSIINNISDNKIEDILIFDNIYNKINYIAESKERNILKDCILTKLLENNENYRAIKFIDSNNNYFIYDLNNNKII